MIKRENCVSFMNWYLKSNLPIHSLLLCSHLYFKITISCFVIAYFIWIEPLLKDRLSYRATFCLYQRWPLNTDLNKSNFKWEYNFKLHVGARVTRSLVLCVCIVDSCLSLCTFSFGHCVLCSSSIYGFLFPLWYLKLFKWFNIFIEQ